MTFATHRPLAPAAAHLTPVVEEVLAMAGFLDGLSTAELVELLLISDPVLASQVTTHDPAEALSALLTTSNVESGG